jgi:hypothetical protein
MPDRDESTPAPIPIIDPDSWEEGEGFRETLLLHFTEPAANATLRQLGSLLFNFALECSGSWPAHPEGTTGSELRAVVADLRHLQGFLGAVGREHVLSSLGSWDTLLSELAAGQALEVARIADRIENELSERAAE